MFDLEDYKVQLTVNLNGVMLNLRGKTDDEVNMRWVAWLERLKKIMTDMEQLKEDIAFRPEGLHKKFSDPFKDTKCPKCGSDCWDNRSPGSKKSSQSPDFKCKNKECGRAAWVKDGKLSWSKN